MSKFNAAVIGAGMIASAHCEAYCNNSETQLVAVADPIAERASAFGSKYGAKSFVDYTKILKEDTIDIVSICTPDNTHADLAVEALNAGKHVVVEKPMALTLEDCDRIIDAQKRSGRELIVDFEYRINPFFVSMKKSVDSGELGALKAMSIYYWRQPFRVKVNRWIHRSRFTSMMLQEACHYVDIFRWFCGEVEEVYAWATKIRDDMEYDQVAFTELSHENGIHSQYSHTVVGNQFHHDVWLIGTRGAIKSSMVFSKVNGSYGEIMRKRFKEDITEDIVEDFDLECFGAREVDDDPNIGRLIDDAISRLISKKPPRVNAFDGRKSIELALAIEESAKMRKPVHLPLAMTPDFVTKRLHET